MDCFSLPELRSLLRLPELLSELLELRLAEPFLPERVSILDTFAKSLGFAWVTSAAWSDCDWMPASSAKLGARVASCASRSAMSEMQKREFSTDALAFWKATQSGSELARRSWSPLLWIAERNSMKERRLRLRLPLDFWLDRPRLERFGLDERDWRLLCGLLFFLPLLLLDLRSFLSPRPLFFFFEEARSCFLGS